MRRIEEYNDIIDIKRPKSSRCKMTIYDRAAQFAPFAALTGYEASINEAKREVSKKIELTDEALDIINQRINFLRDKLKENIIVNITYYIPDLTKDGGRYETIFKSIKKIVDDEKKIVLSDRLEIKLEDILNIDCELFHKYDLSN